MSTPNCSDFVTRAEYEQLLIQLRDLQFEISSVQLDLSGHKSLDVPQAHNYRPQFEVVTELNQNVLTTAVVIEGESQSDVVEFPNSVIPSVTCDIFDQGDRSYVVKVGVNGEFDEDVLSLPEPEQLDFVISEINSGQFDFQISLGNQLKTQTLNVTVADDEQPELTQSNLVLDAEYNEINNVLTITVADGESSATASVFIDANVINDFGGGGTDVSCENFSQELTQCCADLSQEFQECCGQLLSAIGVNLQKIQELEQYVTIDVSSTVCSDYKCEFPKDDDDEIIPTYAEATLVEKSFEGKGIAGINERLKYLAVNQDAMYKEICKAVPPPIDIPLDQTLNTFCVDNNLKTADDFDDDQGFFDYIKGEVLELLGNSILSALVKRLSFIPGGGVGAFAVSSTMQWAIGWLIEKSKAEEVQGLKTICEAIAELELDTVTMIASEKELGRIEGKVLTLHFVTEGNYPKRAKGSNKRPIHIPAPKDSYDWDADFKNIRWVQGNQYAKLKLEGYKQGITGWFRDAAAANACFDQLLQLTTAEEKGRNIPEHTNGRDDIPVRVTRPYRAFIGCEEVPGEPKTLIKYFPPQDEAEN